jgi:hypothetical protein
VITVANRSKGERGTAFAGRPGPLGNPFVVGRDGDEGRCVEIFKLWYATPAASPMRAAAARLPDDAVLECPGCRTPRGCHASVIAAAENERRGLA